MSEEGKDTTSNKTLAAPNSPKPESPTTARPLDFDDEPQESGVIPTPQPAGAPSNATEAPPPMPPRPLSPRHEAQNTLTEAFPSVETGVVKAVLVASNWDVERAFHALLSMTDPNAEQDVPPAKPPRPSQQATSTARTQMEADELYARQLAEHYNRRVPSSHREGERQYQQSRDSSNSEDRDYSFFDDDLPVIRDNIRKGFLETQSKVNSWVQNLKKRIDGEEVDDAQSGQGYETPNYGRPRPSGELGRRSGDREHYDADPQVLSDDFTALELRDSEAPPSRPLSSSALRKTSSSSPDRRKVSFQEGPPTEIDNPYTAPEARRTPSSGSKSSKWQPLSTVEPSPVVEHDPFSLGDSDDEKDARAKDQSNTGEGDRIKEATTDAMAGEIGSGSKDSGKGEGSGK